MFDPMPSAIRRLQRKWGEYASFWVSCRQPRHRERLRELAWGLKIVILKEDVNGALITKYVKPEEDEEE